MTKAGENPDVVLEATYGWYWAVDVLQAAGASVHLAHPLGVKGFTYRRVKNDVRDAEDLADLLRMGRLPEAYVAPPVVRELRELVRHRAKLVAMRSSLKAQVHAVLAKQGLHIPVTDLFGVGGRELLAASPLDGPFRARVDALCRLVDAVEFEIDAVAGPLRARLAGYPGYRAVQAIPGVGPVLAAVFVAEIGEVDRFADARHLVSWAGLTPKHRESDLVVHRGRITKQGSVLVRWAAVEAAHSVGRRAGWLVSARSRIADLPPVKDRRTAWPQHRHRRGGPQAAHPRLLRPTRRAHPCPAPGQGGSVSRLGRDRMRGRSVSGPRRPAAWPRI
jgi:transposase